MESYGDDIRSVDPGTIQYKWQVITYSAMQTDDKCYVLLESRWFNNEEKMKNGYDIIDCFCTKDVIVRRNILT